MIRISTIIRIAEDTVVSGATAVKNRARAGAHAVGVEYRARQVAAAARAVEKQEALLANMTAAQRRAHNAEVREINRRAAELRRAKRK